MLECSAMCRQNVPARRRGRDRTTPGKEHAVKISARQRRADPVRESFRPIRITAHLCLAVFSIVCVSTALIWGKPYIHAWQLVLAHLVGGRPLNASVGTALGFGRTFVLFQACMQDLILSLYLYPCIVSGYRFAARWPVAGRALHNTHRLAVEHKDRLAPYGMAGLAIFVILPLWGTGPYVGVAAGYLMGLSTTRTFAAVTAGNVVAVALWIGVFDAINDELAEINRNLPWAPAAAILVLSVVAMIWHSARKRRRAKKGP